MVTPPPRPKRALCAATWDTPASAATTSASGPGRTRFMEAPPSSLEVIGLDALHDWRFTFPAQARKGPGSAARGPLCAAVRRWDYSVPLNNNRFGVPFPFPVITPAVEFVMIQFETVADGWSPKVPL